MQLPNLCANVRVRASIRPAAWPPQRFNIGAGCEESMKLESMRIRGALMGGVIGAGRGAEILSVRKSCPMDPHAFCQGLEAAALRNRLS
jgi:hypothetical protein